MHAKSEMNDSWLKFVQIPYLPEIELTRNDSQFIEKTLTHVQNDIKNTPIYGLNDTPIEQIANKLDAYKYVFSRKSDWTGPLNYYRNFPFYRIKAGETVRCPCLIVIGELWTNAFDLTIDLRSKEKSSNVILPFFLPLSFDRQRR